MAKILAPNKEYTGVSASVPFVNGVGESTNPALLAWFRDHGYEVLVEAKMEDKPLSKMKKDELLAVAAKMELEVPDGASNADLVKLIEAARG